MIQLSQIAYNVKAKGGAEGDGTVSNEDVAINQALANHPIVYVPDGRYNISKTIIVPVNTTLILGRRANIVPVSNIDIIKLSTYSYVEGGYVDVSSVEGYNKSILSMGKGESIENVKVYNLQATNNITNPKGIALNLDCTIATNKKAMYSRFKGFSFTGFQYGIYTDSFQTVKNFANANYFDGIVSFCTSAIYNANSDGNYYNITGQAQKPSNNEPAVYLKGNNNILGGTIFDIGLAGYSNVYLEIDGIRNTILTDINRRFIIDHKEGSNFYVKSPSETLLYPSKGQGISGFFGQQDNFLADADKRFAVTEKFVNTANWSDISYQFKTNGNTLVETSTIYHFNDTTSLTDNVQIEIDLLAAYYIRGFGFITTSGYTKKVILSFYTVSDNAWRSKTLYPTSSGVVYISLQDVFGYVFTERITKLRIQLFEPTVANLGINSIFANSGHGGNAYLPARGGKLYGDVDFNNNKLSNAVLQQAATGNRPTSPTRGQMFYDTTLNKPIWFNGTAWTDAIGTTV